MTLALLPALCCAAGLSRTNLLEYAESSGAIRPIHSTNDWNMRRQSILDAMQEVMGPLPARLGPVRAQVEEEADCGDYIRRRITYSYESGAAVPAFLLIPKRVLSLSNAAPAVLALHQTHALGYKVVVGLGNSPDDAYGVELAQRGYVVMAPSYPLLANYQPDLKKLGFTSGTMKAITDNMRGLDYLESLPFVRRGVFGAIGHSLGGHNSIYTAAFDSRIKAVASSCGFDSYRDYMNGNITGWTSDRYMPRLKTYSLEALPFDFHEVIGALAPRPVFVSAPLHDSNFKASSVDAVAAAARPVFALFGHANRLRIEHPECAHRFPKEMREAAYMMFDQHLNFKSGD
jgi:dienelactone hydrolase